jgi:NAD(P)-dependent dehydrogenase (short-subunit alcohol dehydrogenase family)
MSYLEELFSLEGKTAVVIGGTGELCGAMAESLAGAGAEVVLVGRNEQKAAVRLETISAAGGRGYFVSADVASRDSLEVLLRTVLEKSGKCDILVNGAGVNSPTPFLDFRDERQGRLHYLPGVRQVLP